MRIIYFCLGWVMVALGVIGLVMPLMPGVVFLIVAAACFARSSPRLEAWLLDHPTFGKPLRDWRAAGAIPRPAKAVQRARPRDEPERFVLRPPFGVTLADAFARLDYGGVERVMRQRQFRPNLAQAQLPQPRVRASGADCRS